MTARNAIGAVKQGTPAQSSHPLDRGWLRFQIGEKSFSKGKISGGACS
jgi:hypothetical protein